MNKAIKNFDQALETVDQDYEHYCETMTNDGMVPLTFKEWAVLEDPQQEVWVD